MENIGRSDVLFLQVSSLREDLRFSLRPEVIYLYIFPFNGCYRRGESKSSLDFLGIVVANGVTVGNLTLTVYSTCSEEHALSEGGLTAVAVAEKADVADFVDFIAHLDFSPCVANLLHI